MDFEELRAKANEARLILQRYGQRSLSRWLQKQDDGDLILHCMTTV